MNRNRDDLPTLRVTNVSEDASEDDLRDLFSRFGKVFRVYIGRDRETGIGKGYAFVSFEDRVNAERAMHKVHGMGYDNLILNCQWSREYSSPFGRHPDVDLSSRTEGGSTCTSLIHLIFSLCYRHVCYTLYIALLRLSNFYPLLVRM
jgi:RNA recognition motif-containing protein